METKFISLHIHSMWETTVMHKQVSGCTVNFGPNFPESPFLEFQTRKPPPHPHPISENFRFGMTKVYSRIPPPFRKTSDLGWPKFTLEYPPPFRKTSDLGWPKFTPEYPWREFKNAEQLLHVETLSNPDNYSFTHSKVYNLKNTDTETLCAKCV